MASNLRLEGKVAIVTGGASGTCEATARLFASHGATVVIADVQDSLGLSVASSITPPDRSTYVHCDVRNELQVAAAVNHTVQTHGRLDNMFSNAGIAGPMTGILDLDISGLDDVLAVQVRGMAASIKHAGLAMVAGGIRGSIICSASVAALQGGLGPVAYTTADAALLGLLRVSAGELGVKGVRVNCVSPFGVATPLTLDATKKDAAEFEELVSESALLKGAVLRAADVAAAALFLASDESAFISGHNLIVDGAVTAFNGFLSKVAPN